MTSNETLTPIWPPPAEKDSRAPWIAVAVFGLLVAAVMAFLWLGARGESADRALERDTAIAERDAVNATKIANDAELRTLRNDMAAAQEALDAAQADATDTPTAEEVAEAQAAIDELNSEIERLTAENEDLQDAVEAATTTTTTVAEAPAEGEAESATTTTTPAGTATTVAAATTTAAPAASATTEPAPGTTEPADPNEVGDQLASLYRNDVLGDLQKRCLGDYVLGNLGNTEAVSILALEDPTESDVLETSLRQAVDFCLIAQSAVFG